MVTLSELQKQADELSSEEREGLISYLLEQLPGAPLAASLYADAPEISNLSASQRAGTKLVNITYDVCWCNALSA